MALTLSYSGKFGWGNAYGNEEKHVFCLIDTLEAACVIREFVGGVGGASVTEEYALDLSGEFGYHCWVVLNILLDKSPTVSCCLHGSYPHNVAVGSGVKSATSFNSFFRF